MGSIPPQRMSFLKECHRSCVHAIALARWWRPVVENVPQMCPRLGIDALCAHATHEECLQASILGVGPLDDCARNSGVEAWPPGAGVVFGGTLEERRPRDGADICPWLLVVVLVPVGCLAGKRALRCCFE